MQSLETKSSRPRPKSFETETRPKTFETETRKKRVSRHVSRLHHWFLVPNLWPKDPNLFRNMLS